MFSNPVSPYRPDAEVKEEKKDGGPKQIDAGKEAAIEAEVQAARQRAVVPLETRMKQFRDMLAEKEVSLNKKHMFLCFQMQDLMFKIT